MKDKREIRDRLLIEKKIRQIKKLNTYVENEEVFRKCLVFEPCTQGLFPHEIGMLFVLERMSIDHVRNPALSIYKEIIDKEGCLESLQKRGFVINDLSLEILDKLDNSQLRKIMKKNGLTIERKGSFEMREDIKMNLTDSNIRDSLNTRYYVPSLKGMKVLKEHPELRNVLQNPWGVYSSVDEEKDKNLSAEKRLYISARYEMIYNKSHKLKDFRPKEICGTQINSFINLYDLATVYAEGIYIVGKDIPAGEYYFWGDQVFVLDGHGHQINNDNEMLDFYLSINAGEKITVEGGKFTNIKNICYRYTDDQILTSEHMYRGIKELPGGVYKYQFEKLKGNLTTEKEECSIELYSKYPTSRHYFERGKNGIFKIDEACKYIIILDGKAALVKRDQVESYITLCKKQLEIAKFMRIIDQEEKDESKIIQEDKIFFFASISNPLIEIFIKNIFQDYTIISSPYKGDVTLNCSFSANKACKDEVCLALHLFITGKIDYPKLYGFRVTDLYQYLVSGKSFHYKNNMFYDTAQRLNIENTDGLLKMLRKLCQDYPMRVLVDNDSIRTYTKMLSPEFDMRYYYHTINNESMYNKMYQVKVTQLAEKGLISTKWRSEFSLYVLTKKFFPNAIYQYRAAWLGRQSIDIFIPAINVGIEYQGIQHYEAIDVFGGTDGLICRNNLDNIKRIKCSQLNITLIEWKYDLPVTELNFRETFEKENITLPVSKTDFNVCLAKSVNENKKLISKTVIYQYDRKGVFVEQYKTIKDACNAVNSKGVGKAVNGQQDLAGGYYWRKVKSGYPKVNLDIKNSEITPKGKPNGQKKPVCQMDDDGNIIRIFESVTAASMEISVNEKSIHLCAKGKQKHAGGFCWRFE